MGLLLTALGLGPGAALAWQAAVVEPRVDNLEALVAGCRLRHEETLARERATAAWAAYQTTLQLGASLGIDARIGLDASLGLGASLMLDAALVGGARAPAQCAGEAITARLQGGAAGVWGMVVAQGDLLFATVNLPAAGVLVSTDGGRRWHYRHLFLPGHNVDGGVLLRGIDYRGGLLAVASQGGILLSRDAGRTFTTALAGEPFWAVAISPASRQVLVAGGERTSYLSRDGGATWTDLRFSDFTAGLLTPNRFRIDHITSLEFDPRALDTVYVGTGSHLYRLALSPAPGAPGTWQAMEGDGPARVLDDSTVYNIEVGSRLMISTCNGVYWAERLGGDRSRPQAEVVWRKFRDPAFSKRGVGGPKGNLRSYFVAEDPADRDRVLVADFAGLYEGRAADGAMSWRRVEELPFYAPGVGYPEYTTIAWPAGGTAVVGSRYRGIFVHPAAPPRPARGGGPSCFLP